jgi:hypothetical protein
VLIANDQVSILSILHFSCGEPLFQMDREDVRIRPVLDQLMRDAGIMVGVPTLHLAHLTSKLTHCAFLVTR